MQKEETTYLKLYNFWLVTHLSLLGHKYIKIIKSTEDNKSYFYFLPSEEIEKDVKAFHDDIPVWIKPRSQEKRYYDIKFAAINSAESEIHKGDKQCLLIKSHRKV